MCQTAALNGLHDNDLFTMTYCGLVTQASLYIRIFPVQIIDLELHKLHFRMFRQHLFQQIRPIVKRKTNMLHLSFHLFLPYKSECVQFLCLCIADCIYIVQNIVIDSIQPQSFQLALKYLFHLFLSLQQIQRQFIRDCIGKSRMSFYYSLTESGFTFAFMIGICRIKIGKTPFQKTICHVTYRLTVYFPPIIFLQQRQPHQAKSKLIHIDFFSLS